MEIKIAQVKNPEWANEEKTIIKLLVDFGHLDDDFIEFYATLDDTEIHGRELYEKAKTGEYGTIADYKPVIPAKKQIQLHAKKSVEEFIKEKTVEFSGTNDPEREKRFLINQAAAIAYVKAYDSQNGLVQAGIVTPAQEEALEIQLQRQKLRSKQPHAEMDLLQFAQAIVAKSELAIRAAGLIEDLYMYAMDRIEELETVEDSEQLMSELKTLAAEAEKQLAQG